VFTRPEYVWEGLPRARAVTMAPCIDVLSAKNRPLDDRSRDAVLAASGIVPGAAPDPAARVRPASLVEEAPVPAHARLVVQVSRWDGLKDPAGLVRAFASDGPTDPCVHLVVAGPMDGVADDPESTAVFADVRRAWEGLPDAVRRRVHLARLPMDDRDENAMVVNALQRRADVVVQKSLAEGFGLTVAEAMWKARPVVASRVGGIQDQIVHGDSGLLVDDPADAAAFGRAMSTLLGDRVQARAMGAAARARVRDRYLPVQQFAAEADLVAATV
jgi:trehalose synthase